MAWRLARSLETLRSELNAAYPLRDTAADGTIGDPAHQSQGSASDHNPWIKDSIGTPVVRAFDITSDPIIDPTALADRLRALGEAGDPRMLHYGYVIYNGRIAGYSDGPDPARWLWRAYDGDPHTSHIHLSVTRDQAGYDATTPWTENDVVSDADIKKIVDQVVVRLANDATHPNTLASLHSIVAAIKTEVDRLVAKAGA